LVGIGAVSLHIVIPLLAVVALSHVVIKFLETYPANSKARFAAKMRRQVIKGKVSIDVAERLMHLDDPGTADNGTGSLATSRADPTSPQHLQRFPEAPSTLWPTWELPEDYELPAQQEETKLVKLVRLVVDASTAHRRQR
jgi:hypothetical protein